jgi:hypothetical protein
MESHTRCMGSGLVNWGKEESFRSASRAHSAPGVARRLEEDPAARDATHARCRINKDTEGRSEEVTGPYNQANFPIPVSCPIIDLLRSPLYLLFGIGLTTMPSARPAPIAPPLQSPLPQQTV